MRYTLLAFCVLLPATSVAQDADLNRAYEVCSRHADRDPRHPSVILGFPEQWKDCPQIVDAWTAARKAQDDADQIVIIKKVLPKIQK